MNSCKKNIYINTLIGMWFVQPQECLILPHTNKVIALFVMKENVSSFQENITCKMSTKQGNTSRKKGNEKYGTRCGSSAVFPVPELFASGYFSEFERRRYIVSLPTPYHRPLNPITKPTLLLPNLLLLQHCSYTPSHFLHPLLLLHPLVLMRPFYSCTPSNICTPPIFALPRILAPPPILIPIHSCPFPILAPLSILAPSHHPILAPPHHPIFTYTSSLYLYTVHPTTTAHPKLHLSPSSPYIHPYPTPISARHRPLPPTL